MTVTDGPLAGARRQHAELINRLRGEVADQLTARMQADQAAGRPALDPTGQRVLAGQLIVDLLDREAKAALAAGRPVLTSSEEEQVTQAIQDLLFGLGRLQRLLDDPQVENINANGCDRVWVRYADGRRVQVDPIADSDGELVETDPPGRGPAGSG
jgi:pilus assembly protein CpaF